MRHPSSSRSSQRAFTLIELVVVMAMLGLLLSLALPQYMAALERGREQVLQQNLAVMREAIDKFYGDRGRYPEKLEDLVTYRYLRAIPNDPFTETPSWLVVAHKDPDKGGVIDVQSSGNDIGGEPRRSPDRGPGGEPGQPGGALPNFVSQEGGSTQVILVAPPGSAASSGAAGVAP